MRTNYFTSIRRVLLFAFLLVTKGLTAQNITVNSTSPMNQPMWLVQNVMVGPNMTVFSPIGPLGMPMEIGR
ncbi:MAG TPA: hypothetical protein DCL07_05430, partial [Cryomorphaceae bacterium]|nr:hypothetical protein [Cryomorphaceae bacterium]